MRLAALVMMSTMVFGCAHKAGDEKAAPATAANAPAKSLYERLGGKPAITAVVDEFVAARRRRQAHQRALPQHRHPRSSRCCWSSSSAWRPAGPCKYDGRDMHDLARGHAARRRGVQRAGRGSRRRARQVQRAREGEGRAARRARAAQAADRQSAAARGGQARSQARGQAARQTVDQAAHERSRTEAADLLEAAVTARTRGQRSTPSSSSARPS